MTDKAKIEAFLREQGVVLSGCIVGDYFERPRFYVFVEVSRGKNNLQIPSNLKLTEFRNEFVRQGIDIEFILTDSKQLDIEAGIRASLLHSFGSLVRNVFLSTNGEIANIWIVPKTKISNSDFTAIQKRIGVFLGNFGLEMGGLNQTSNENIPTKTACINVLRRIAPADLAKLGDALRKKGFTVPSEGWMAHMADSLRKSGLVVRLKSGKYALSLAGLMALGSAKNAKSPDISRLLDLARLRD